MTADLSIFQDGASISFAEIALRPVVLIARMKPRNEFLLDVWEAYCDLRDKFEPYAVQIALANILPHEYREVLAFGQEQEVI